MGEASAIGEQKRALRGQMRAMLRAGAADAAAVVAGSAAVVAHLRAWAGYRERGVVLAYLPLGWAGVGAPAGVGGGSGEVDLSGLWAFEEGRSLYRPRTLCLPRVEWGSGRMSPAVVGDLSRDVWLGEGPGGVVVPQAGPFCPLVGLDELELVLVPGLAFSVGSRGVARLGRGGGFYDRLLAELPRRAVALGVGWESQVVEQVPAEGHDVELAGVVTPAGIRWCGAGG